MGLVKDVVTALKAAGIRAEEAWPGKRMPAITEPVAAVFMEQVDDTAQTACVQIQILSPEALGGGPCETAAETAADAAGALGAACLREACQFDASTDCYRVAITAAFSTAPAAERAFSVVQSGTTLDGAVGFTAWREADADNEITLASAQWQIRLVEEFQPGQREETVTTDPFQLTVTRTAGVEVFTSCTWTEVKREDTEECLRQTRTGTAGGRSYIAK